MFNSIFSFQLNISPFSLTWFCAIIHWTEARNISSQRGNLSPLSSVKKRWNFHREEMTDAPASDSTGQANSSNNPPAAANPSPDTIPVAVESTVTNGETSTEPRNGEKPTKKGKRPTAFAKECVLSPELAAFLGQERMTRSEVVSNMWKTIRERGLIDPNQKQFAVCDEQLFKVIGRKRFKVFGMMKFLKSHVKDAPN